MRQVRFHDLRHTFATRMAAASVPMRTIQEWMGHRDFKTTLIYADYAPSVHELDLVNSAWSKSSDPVVYQTVYQPESNSEHLRATNPVGTGVIAAQRSRDH